MILGSSRKEQHELPADIEYRFDVRIEETLKMFLGLVFDMKTDGEVLLHSSPSLNRIYTQFNMTSCRVGSKTYKSVIVLNMTLPLVSSE